MSGCSPRRMKWRSFHPRVAGDFSWRQVSNLPEWLSKLETCCHKKTAGMNPAVRVFRSHSVVPAEVEDLQDIPEEQRHRGEEFEAGRHMLVRAVMMHDVRGVVDDEPGGEGYHQSAEQQSQR